LIASPGGLAVGKPIGRLTEYVEHSRSPAKRASTTACEAGAPTRFVWCNALFCGVLPKVNPFPIAQSSFT